MPVTQPVHISELKIVMRVLALNPIPAPYLIQVPPNVKGYVTISQTYFK